MDNNLFQTIFDKYSHSVEGSEYKYLCEVDAKKAMDEYAVAFAIWCAKNDCTYYTDDEWCLANGAWANGNGVMELFNNDSHE